ncbi:MAG: carboxypeptidase regulatory-like domain-containing protein [Thermoanaerobaculia bacterium]
MRRESSTRKGPGSRARATALAVAVGLVGALGAARAESWSGGGRIAGVVHGPDRAPLAGARVTLHWADPHGPGPDPVASDRQGRFAVPGLASGRWFLDVVRDGLSPGGGRIDLDADRPPPPVRIDLELGPAEIEAAFVGPPPPPVDPEALGYARLALAPHRTGLQIVSFSTPSPARSGAEYLARLGLAPDFELPAIDLARESFALAVPETYRAGDAHGLVVWVSPFDFGGALRPEVRAELARRKLLWVGANRAGNDRDLLARFALAFDAAWNMARAYDIDARRVYLAGFSGGGRVASTVAPLFPEIFRGAIFLMGCDYFRSLPVPGRPGAEWSARYPKPATELLQLDREARRFVFLTGELDFNRSQTEATYEAARRDGFRHLLYLEVPQVDHRGPVPAEFFARALDFLDGAPPAGRG